MSKPTSTNENYEAATHVYIARRSCGCASGFAVDGGGKETARDVASFIKSGRTVDRVPLTDARAIRFRTKCEHMGGVV